MEQMTAKTIEQQLLALANEEKARVLSSFFQTKKGQYAEGDVFLGVTVPQTRAVVAHCRALPLSQVAQLLQSKYHECRFAALVILVNQFEHANEAEREVIYNFYLTNTAYINNWDLVDVSCHKIVGAWLLERDSEDSESSEDSEDCEYTKDPKERPDHKERADRTILYDMAKSNWLWDQRIAIVSTWAFIRNHEFEDTLRLSEYFLTHTHHLLHKACGWMLREVGKRNKATLIAFLDKFAPHMPRVMLRYSIEKLSGEERKNYLRAKIK